MKRRLFLFFLCLCCTVSLVACGGGDGVDVSPGVSEPPTVTGSLSPESSAASLSPGQGTPDGPAVSGPDDEAPYIPDAEAVYTFSPTPGGGDTSYFTGLITFIDDKTLLVQQDSAGASEDSQFLLTAPDWTATPFPSNYIPSHRLADGRIVAAIYTDFGFSDDCAILDGETFELLWHIRAEDGVAYIHVSPDGERIAYSRDQNLYTANLDFSDERLVAEGVDTDEEHFEEGEACRAIGFINNEKLLYYRVGYEWIIHYGIADVSGEDIPPSILPNLGEIGLELGNLDDTFFCQESFGGGGYGLYTLGSGLRMFFDAQGAWHWYAYDPNFRCFAVALPYDINNEMGARLQIVDMQSGDVLADYVDEDLAIFPSLLTISRDGHYLCYIDLNAENMWTIYALDLTNY
ncbi:hypothetical protein LJC32_00105 [Oscillospiraceae bacterium OttesenSCG-928-F05]|nr:hypothetical protein [Oscillospiraceae bacterium OttesenSCG-928-F05]